MFKNFMIAASLGLNALLLLALPGQANAAAGPATPVEAAPSTSYAAASQDTPAGTTVPYAAGLQ